MNASEKNKIPVAAIVGRPNVGKSTFFNRLIRRRKAITDPTPGVTRDPVSHIYERNGLKVKLIDTGGVRLSKEGLDPLVSSRSRETAKEADILILVLDATEITAEDEDLIRFCRVYADKLMVTVNKVDSAQREASAYAFYAYGFPEIFMISAEHNIGIDEWEEAFARRLEAAGFQASDEFEDETTEEKEPPLRIAVLGHIPGTTRDTVEGRFRFGDRNFTVIDTAGIRRKRSVGENVEYYSVNRAIASIDGCDIVFLMIDAEKGLADQDKKIAAQAVNRGKGIILVLNKWDLVPPHRDAQRAAADRIRFLFPVLSFAPIVFISAKDNQGIPALLKTALRMEAQFRNKITTNKLNTALAEWVYENPVPSKGKIKYKVKYLTQLSAAPVKFAVFVNRKKGFPDSWMQYMVNRIRSVFGFKDVPIRLEIKENRKGEKQ